ncbi:hypothetical protein C6P41_003909 [Kluyveromyces marxianus]|nr:hypothetical protein C6P43_001896 [Kluyveromyces marxianus]KAG0685685.1 hypothetical protein C6P41_003909 [Kluyveromyces marxianus]
MKFGSQILVKSVPEWKLNNIDYQQLKTGIKKCTTVRENFHPANAEEDPELRSLEKLFRSQFEMINVFVSMKLKECSTRIVSIENYLTQVGNIKDENKQLRRIKLINHHLDRCNFELQKLSRYLILQKIAIRKLFKKFLKHYPYGKDVAQEFIDSLKNCPELKEGHDGVSLLTVDLDPYLLEISLIVDILHELEVNSGHEPQQSLRHPLPVSSNNTTLVTRPSTADSVHTESIPSSSRKTSIASPLNNIDSTLSFDHLFVGRFHHVKSFLISQESEDEIKFMLVKLGFCLFDNTVMATSKKILSGNDSLIKRKNSIKSLHMLRDASIGGGGGDEPAASSAGQPQEQPEVVNNVNQETISHNIQFEPLAKAGVSTANLYASTEENLFPNMLVSYPNSEECVLLCHVGGLRNHISTDTINYKDIKDILNGVDPANPDHSNRLDEFCREWCYSHNIRLTDFVIKSKRSRFIVSTSSLQTDNDYLICIDENIEVDSHKIPFAVLEIKMLERNNSVLGPQQSKSKKTADPVVAQIIDKLIEDDLSVYPVTKRFTLWNLASKVVNGSDPLTCIDDGNFLSSEEMFESGKNLLKELKTNYDLQLNPPIIDLSKPPSPSSNKSIPINRTTEPDKPRIRYWNEFDDDEEAMDQGFYTYSSDEDDKIHDYGLITFSPAFIVAVYRFISKFQFSFGFVGDVQERRHLLPSPNKSYSSLNTESTVLTSHSSERNEVNKIWDFEQQESESIYEFEHDEVISFFYVSSLLISCLTTGITIGIMTSLFKSLDEDSELDNGTPILIMIFVSLAISLILSSWSLLLLFSRFTLAPTWHYVSGVVIFIIIILAVCYGFIELIL